MSKLIIEKFMPPKYERTGLDIENIEQILEKKLYYASDGKSALYYILEALGIKGKLLIPSYICDSILIPIKQLKVEPIFYDLCIDDLNASYESICDLLHDNEIAGCLVASMYGNPADLTQIEKLCKEQKILMIDDAAQAFGARIGDKYVGTFGDAGFFSFAPGKPLSAHMGALFWVNGCPKKLASTKHVWFHRLSYWDFYLNRVCRYKTHDRFKFLYLLRIVFWKFIDISKDGISEFENKILGGAIDGLLTNSFDFRENYFEVFRLGFPENEKCRLVTNLIGQAHPHKLVFLFQNQEIAKAFINFMKKKCIYANSGYSIISKKKYLKNCLLTENCIVEAPIENSDEKMNYLLQAMVEFLNI